MFTFTPAWFVGEDEDIYVVEYFTDDNCGDSYSVSDCTLWVI